MKTSRDEDSWAAWSCLGCSEKLVGGYLHIVQTRRKAPLRRAKQQERGRYSHAYDCCRSSSTTTNSCSSTSSTSNQRVLLRALWCCAVRWVRVQSMYVRTLSRETKYHRTPAPTRRAAGECTPYQLFQEKPPPSWSPLHFPVSPSWKAPVRVPPSGTSRSSTVDRWGNKLEGVQCVLEAFSVGGFP